MGHKLKRFNQHGRLQNEPEPDFRGGGLQWMQPEAPDALSNFAASTFFVAVVCWNPGVETYDAN